jgi:hypothetical protein
MPNIQLTVLIVAIFGSEWLRLLYLSNHIDRLADEIKAVGLKLDRLTKEKE